jgi:diguanylate cyclase (GGDEF)-like protein/PAS domain S-box-containing protein
MPGETGFFMTTRFDVTFGQQLCDVLAAELGFVCNFMGAKGCIVASSERSRIGSIHAVADQIMRGEIDEYGVSKDEAAQSGIMREGINMGIDFEGSRLISFSIAGPLDVVRPLARIVRFCVKALLRVRQEEDSLALDPVSLSAFRPPEMPAPTPVASTMSTDQLTQLLSHASETIEHSLSRLRDAVNHIDQGITMFDPEMRLMVWNKRFLELMELPSDIITFGLSLETIVRYAAARAGHGPDAIEAMVAKRMAVVRLHQSQHHVFVMPNGRVLELVDRSLPNGSFVSTYTDVTVRHQDQDALRAAYDHAERLVEERTHDLRQFSELSSDWFWEQDAQLRFIEFSGHATDKLQRSKSSFFGLRRWDLPISGVTAAQLAQHVATCERHEPFRDFEYLIPGDDGVPQYYCISGMPVFTRQGVFAGYRGIGRNITDLRLAEAAIKDRERQLSQIVNGSPIPTFVMDAQHRVTHWNQACANITELDASQMIGSLEVWRAFYWSPHPTLADLLVSGKIEQDMLSPDTKFKRSNLCAGAVESENFFPQLGKLGGDGLWLHFTAAPLFDSEGQLTGAIETLQDITDRRRAERLLNIRTESLQLAHAELEQRVRQRTAEVSQQLHFMQQLIEAIPGPVYYKDANSRYLGCNSAYETFTGLSSSEIVGKTPRDIAPKDLAEKYVTADRELLDHPGSQIYESQVRYANGELRDVMFHKATFTQSDGSVGGLVGLMLDISERRRMEERLRQAATVFDSSTEGVTITTPEGNIIAVNRAFTEITGYEENEVVGNNSRLLQSGRHDKNFYRQMWNSIADEGRWEGEICNRRKSGELYPQWITIVAVRDKQGTLTNYIATFSDITRHKQNEEKIQRLAYSDPLTGLPNRRLLLDRLGHALITSSQNKHYGALFFIDLDDFKSLNDTRGHETGDLLLQQVCLRLLDCVRPADTVARLSGDEFVVMLENLDDDALTATHQAESLGSKMLEAFKRPFALNDYWHHCTASMGVTLFVELQSTREELLKQADLALYRAKNSGRNTLRFFDPEMQSKATARATLEADLRQGIRDGQLTLHYQPQTDTLRMVTGAEALVRWNHPVRGMVPPGQFIALAEETTLILEIGTWVLEAACKQLHEWATIPAMAGLTMAVNVSARQFRQTNFVDQVITVLKKNAVNPHKLKLEQTESLLLEDVEEIIAKMMALKEIGVCFSLDDFGTGYSSLSYLKRLPLDQLKIDQSFVRDVLVDANDASIARAIVSMAHSLGLAVIAEGVETEAQREFLADNQCHAYQGYLFSRPLPQAQFKEFVIQVGLGNR